MFTLKLLRELPSRETGRAHGDAPVQVWRDLADAVCAYGYAGDGWWSIEWPGVGRFRFGPSAGDRVIEVASEPGVSMERIGDVFNRSVMPLVLQVSGCETLHASAVTTHRGVVGFCGERRAGKSTVAFGLHRRGFTQHADDTLVLTVGANTVTTRPLPFAPRLRPASVDFFCGFDLPATEPGRPPERLAALFILRPEGQTAAPAVRSLAPTEAFRALLAHAHCFEPANPGARRRLLQNYLEISAVVPVFDATYEPGLERLDTLLDALQDAAGVGAEIRASA